MIHCTFNETVNHPDGSYTRSQCVAKADILLINDPCYGLCYHCAYKKVNGLVSVLVEALEKIQGGYVANMKRNSVALYQVFVKETATQALSAYREAVEK